LRHLTETLYLSRAVKPIAVENLKPQSRVSQGLSILQRQVSVFLFALAALVQVSLPVADQAFHRANGQTDLVSWHDAGAKAADAGQDHSPGSLPDTHEHDCPICLAMLDGAGAALVPDQIVFTLATQVASAALIDRPAVSLAARYGTASQPRAPPILI
jgi:hypothetical protein